MGEATSTTVTPSHSRLPGGWEDTSLHSLWETLNEGRPPPEVTIDAIMHSVKTLGRKVRGDPTRWNTGGHVMRRQRKGLESPKKLRTEVDMRVRRLAKRMRSHRRRGMSASVIPFPLTRRRGFVERHADIIGSMTDESAERHLAYQLKVQRDALQRRCVAGDRIDREIACLERAILVMSQRGSQSV